MFDSLTWPNILTRLVQGMQKNKIKKVVHRIQAFVKGLCVKNGSHACIGGRYRHRWRINYNFGTDIDMYIFLQRWWAIKVPLKYHPQKDIWRFTGNAGTFWRSLKLQRYTGQLSFIFTLRVESSFWSTSTKTWWARTMSSTLFTRCTLLLTFSYWFVYITTSFLLSII